MPLTNLKYYRYQMAFKEFDRGKQLIAGDIYDHGIPVENRDVYYKVSQLAQHSIISWILIEH